MNIPKDRKVKLVAYKLRVERQHGGSNYNTKDVGKESSSWDPD